MSDVKLDGEYVIVEGVFLKSKTLDIMLDHPSRRSNNQGERRALVHDPSDGLTINYDEDYPGGVTIRGDLKTDDVTIRGDLKADGGATIQGQRVYLNSNSGATVEVGDQGYLSLSGRAAGLCSWTNKINSLVKVSSDGRAEISGDTVSIAAYLDGYPHPQAALGMSKDGEVVILCADAKEGFSVGKMWRRLQELERRVTELEARL